MTMTLIGGSGVLTCYYIRTHMWVTEHFLPFHSDHIVQHILGQSNPAKQGSDDPGSCKVLRHWHHLVSGIRWTILLGGVSLLVCFASFVQSISVEEKARPLPLQEGSLLDMMNPGGGFSVCPSTGTPWLSWVGMEMCAILTDSRTTGPWANP